MILLGYPGIGKSTACKNRSGWVDLESSNFDLKTDDGVAQYCKVAMDLSDQEKVIFVSTHEKVRKFFESVPKETLVAVVYPDLSFKEAWIKKLSKRYKLSKLDKDFRALDRVLGHYEEDIEALMTSSLVQIRFPNDGAKLEYVIKNYIENLCFELGHLP